MPQQRAKKGIRPSRIPQNIDAAQQIVRGAKTTDLLLTVLLPALGVIILLYTNLITPVQAGIAGGAVFALNFVLFRFLPDQASITYWVKSLFVYGRTPKIMTKHGYEPPEDIEIEFLEAETGGRNPANGTMFDFIELNEETTELTLIDEVDIENGVVRLEDGSFVAGVTVEGMGMLLADDDMQESARMKYQQALNSLNFPITVRGTSRQFDISSIINRYEERLSDTDIKDRPVMERVLKAKKQFIQQEVKKLGMNNKEYSIIIRASYQDNSMDNDPFDFNIIDPQSPIGQKLQEWGVGITKDGSVEDELVKKATDRADTVAKAIQRNRRLDADPMTGDELADSLRFFWRREEVDSSGWQPASPLVANENGLTDTEANDSTFDVR